MRLFLALFAPLLILASAAFAVTLDDPHVWLEDVHGEKQLIWVKGENAKALGPLKADPRYQKNYDSLMQVLDATAFALCRDQKLPIKVFSIFKHGALKRVVMGEDEGTLVHV